MFCAHADKCQNILLSITMSLEFVTGVKDEYLCIIAIFARTQM